MHYLIGFVIALFIALTGVGAGTITVPVLVLFLGVPAPVAVGIGLMFCHRREIDPGARADRAHECGLAHARLHACSAECRAFCSVRCFSSTWSTPDRRTC